MDNRLKRATGFFKEDLHNFSHTSFIFLRWIFFAVITGAIVGALSLVFLKTLNWVTACFAAHHKIIFLLPVAGCLIVFLYHIFDYKNDKGTNLVLSTIQAKSELPIKMAPLIFVATALTHLFGGSAGREGAALQFGGSIGNFLGHLFRMDENDTRVIVMCGMSAAFSALFGTPMAAAIFSLEVVSVGVMYYAALVPCVFSSLVASLFASRLEIDPEQFFVSGAALFNVRSFVIMTILGILCAGLSILFCRLLHSTGALYREKLTNPYIRIIASSCLIIALTYALGTFQYSGSGIPLIEEAFAGHVTPLTFFWKMIFTALTLEAGFKGGEIVPSFTVGATFGCLYGIITHTSPSLCAAVGMTAMFCGVTNCPITSMLIGFELFGFGQVKFMLIAVSVSYMLSGYYSLYKEQTIVYSKYKTQYINRKTN